MLSYYFYISSFSFVFSFLVKQIGYSVFLKCIRHRIRFQQRILHSLRFRIRKKEYTGIDITYGTLRFIRILVSLQSLCIRIPYYRNSSTPILSGDIIEYFLLFIISSTYQVIPILSFQTKFQSTLTTNIFLSNRILGFQTGTLAHFVKVFHCIGIIC